MAIDLKTWMRVMTCIREIEEQRPRLEQMLEDHPDGTPENRLAESVLDSLFRVKDLLGPPDPE